jgi:Glyoxalase-like domain
MYRALALALAVSLGCAEAFGQGVEATLNHVVIAVHDLDAAGKVYSTLGLAVLPGGRHPTGTQNAIVRFSDRAYLELISPYDANLSDGKEVAEFLGKGEGAIAAGLEIDSAESAARDLRATGLKVRGPTAGTILLPGETQAPPRWWTVEYEDEVAARPVFLIQYISAPPRPAPAHANSASTLAALLVAVSDMEKAAAAYGNIGWIGDREIDMPEFGAAAKQIALKSGSILLLRATDPSGPTARRLKQRGEGILGVRIGVTDLGKARSSVGNNNVSANDQSVLVSPESAAGVWLQFQSAGQ